MISSSAGFQVNELVHESARSTLYRAVRIGDGRPVVLKVLKPASDGSYDRAGLEHELAVAASVDSPFVVRPYGMTTFQGRPALVLEDSGGRSLDRSLGQPMPIEQFLPLALQVAHALHDVHERGVVHKDIKPANLILAPDGAVKITDFGIACKRALQQAPVAARGFEGTLAYLAPEQTGRFDRPVDARADLYALGVTFYEMLTGSLPFAADDALGWMHSHLARAPRPLTQLVPHLPPALSEIVLRLLAKTPEERYQSARGLAADLERCREEWERERTIHPFRLGDEDASGDFRIPHKLYGRERELAVLASAFARVVEAGTPALTLVRGYSGVGKSALVRGLYENVARQRGFFISGKFDQLQRHVPYSAFSQAVGELVHQLLAVSGERLASWTRELKEALGSRAAVLTEVFPELQLLVGQQPPLPVLGPAETQNRFRITFLTFMRVLATREHPLVLFLDDLQWADSASLELLNTLFEGTAGGPLLGILAYRDNEVDAAHPLSVTRDKLRKAGTVIEELVVAPLEARSVTALISETLHATAESAAPLARLVMDKTGGNPFFVGEFLKTIWLEGLLRFEGSSWTWSLAEIEAKGITENVVELMIERVRRLPAATQRALRLGACIGNSFELERLAIVTEWSVPETAAALREAQDQGLITLRGNAARHGDAPTYSFQHDRIQQAAYALIEERQVASVHLRIGRLLCESLDKSQVESRVFEVVNQFDAALPLIEAPDERARVAQLNVRAARKAKAATAYAQARYYLAKAATLLPPSAWQEQYRSTFDLFAELAECEYLSGQLEQAGERFAWLITQAHDDLDSGKIFYLQIKLLQVAGKFDDAAAVALRSFERFGLSPPRSDAEAAEAVEQEHREARLLLGERRAVDLLDAPRMTDLQQEMLARLLEASAPPMYMVKPALFPWIVMKLLNCSLRHGNAEPSCYGYGVYALLRAAVMGDVETGYEFSWLAIRLNEKLGDVRLKGAMLHLLGDHVNFWKNPIATDLAILERGFAACLEGGDLIYSNYIGFQSPWHLYESGAPLEEVWKLTERYVDFARQSKYSAVLQTIRLEQQFILNLKGMTAGRDTLSSQGFDEEQALSEITSAGFACGIVYCHILKLVSRFTYGDHRGALSSAKLAERDLSAAFSMPIQVSYCLYHALTLAALYAQATPEEQAIYLELLKRHERDFARWSDGCPENFAHKLALVRAEIARVTGRTAEAMGWYERAMTGARDQGFVQYHALACELSAKLYLSAGATTLGVRLLEEAQALYRSWGALGKVAQLEEQHAGLEQRSGMQSHVRTPTATPRQTGTLDLLPVLKASQSISGEMLVPRLLMKLMAIVSEYAAAERGSLISSDGEQLLVNAEVEADAPPTVIPEGRPVQASAYPISILHYVQHTGQRVLLEDARLPNTFSADSYVVQRKPRSILCMPVARGRKLTGMFYLENNFVAGAFSPDRLTVLELLAAQTAISIDNSALYKNAQDAIRLRDEFLSIASHELKTPLTPVKLRLQSLLEVVNRGALPSYPEERLKKLLEASDAQLTRLARLIESLLDVSRIQAGRLVLERESVELSSLAAEVIERHCAELTRSQCAISLQADQLLVGAWDRLRLEQAISNLLANAIKYAPGKPIVVTVTRSGDHARLTVQDRGIGIAKEDLPRVFERFERVESAQNVGGLGLGLFITRRIAEAHGGSLHAESQLGVGTTLVLDLPLGGSLAEAS